MAELRHLQELPDGIAIVGWSCRLPGANGVAELWQLLMDGRCAVSSVPPDRFPLPRYWHPRPQERGKSYTWAAGVLDDVWGFDPSVFGITPREAEQMDPQQRILLQLTWEALEDAGIPAASIAGTETGTFVGASQTDYAHTVFADQAVADAYFATGNALAILANRISNVFDLRGPSLTLDTACSSSLVALHQACETLRSGRIDTAIVGGVNIIASPAEFISFSQASMLSPTGLCHAFAADADGYVRAEGGVVLILRRAAAAASGRNPIRGIVLASDVNSDGRTNGISLPSATAQEALLRRVYSRAGIDPNRLAFVEAHGTGTAVGDPIEAEALGRSLGRARAAPLPIGSIKTNIGHTEAASGLAGVLKAVLALNHAVLPRSLHLSAPNPEIAFDRLNLEVCATPSALPNAAESLAGVNSFGFGGTNAHAIVAAGKPVQPAADWHPPRRGGCLLLSAASKPALIAAAQQHLARLAGGSDRDVAIAAGAIAHRRDRLAHRLVISSARWQPVIEALAAVVAGSEHPAVTSGTVVGHDLPIGFVYSGNGSQWAGMGVAAYLNNSAFRIRFEEVDACFRPLSGWSLGEALFDEGLADRLAATSIAQPLIFAIQCAMTAALRGRGIRPSAVLGHSVGEVAAAEAAGALDLRAAVEVIYYRSKHQEAVRGLGRMAAILASPEEAEYLLGDLPGIEIAAINSPRAITVAGPAEAMAILKKIAASRATPLLDLDLDYPFHTAAMTAIRTNLIADLQHVGPRETWLPFVSTVTGAALPGLRLGAAYWWRNIREPVQFFPAIREAARLGVRFFVEIGPRSTLLRHIADSLPAEFGECVSLAALDRIDRQRDPVEQVLAKALVSGARLDTTEIFGPDPGPAVVLPSYPWQQRTFRYSSTTQQDGAAGNPRSFGSVRSTAEALNWYAHVDTALFPELAGHKVGDQILFPGTGFLEIAFAVGCEWLGAAQVLLTDFEIRDPLDLTDAATREVMTRVSPDSNTIEIFSRVCLSNAGWLLHARCKAFHGAGSTLPAADPPRPGRLPPADSTAIYRLAESCGLRYGPAFRLLGTAARIEDGDVIEVALGPEAAPQAVAREFVLDPMRLDACCHGLLTVFPDLRAAERGVGYLPVRLEEAVLLVAGAVPQRALIEVTSKTERAITADYTFWGAHDEPIAVLRGVYCQAAQIRRVATLEATAFIELAQPIDGSILGKTGLACGAEAIVGQARAAGMLPETTPAADDAGLLIEGCAIAAAYEIASSLAEDQGIDIDKLVATGRVPAELKGWLAALLGSLEAAELAQQADERWRVIGDPLLPSAASVVAELAAKHPARAAEIMVGAAVAELVAQIAAHRAIGTAPEAFLSPIVLDFYDAASVSLREAGDMVARTIEGASLWPKDRALRVLQIGYGPLTTALLTLQRRRNLSVSVLEPDPRRLDAARRSVADGSDFVLLAPYPPPGPGTFDLVVAAESLYRLPTSVSLTDLRRALAPQGVLIAVEPGPSVFRELMLGLDRSAFEPGEAAGDPARRLQQTADWPAVLQRAGFDGSQALAVRCGPAVASLIVAEAAARAVAADDGGFVAGDGVVPQAQRFALIITAPVEADARLGLLLAEQLRGKNFNAAVTHAADFSEPTPDLLIHLLGSGGAAEAEPMARLIARCLEIKSCVERFGSASGAVWHVHRNALAGEGAKIDPVATGSWAYSRTVANEFPHLDVRRIELDPSLPPAACAARLCDIVCSGTSETELQVAETALHAVRVNRIRQALDALPGPPVAAVQLQRRPAAGQRFRWEAVQRALPGADEIEIAIEATGLNFRDLMWVLSLLPDDILEEGLAGLSLGCECAGRVVRVGSSVASFGIGDRVLAFAPSAFATHLTIAAAQAAKLPDGMSFAAGATIPVAFLTAYYSLVVQAKLRRGEWVLVHGGAGGVGMAAIQIARSRGARIIATAGSPAKRRLLEILGVDRVFDSRSIRFVDDVRAVTPSGVDVVLNSLAGEAMERGIRCLRPFGRFVEIGKRDYIANTPIGLRPFRKNLSYFGVDIDQLMAQGAVGPRLFARLMREFDAGRLTPLPHAVFRAADLREAFHLMQHSGHIGKIVVARPELDAARAPGRAFTVDPSGTHVITGGCGGFGLAAATWLVERGARHLALLGRSGAASEEAKAALAQFAKRGVQVLAEPCDIADRRAVERLFEHLHGAMPPVVGVLHAAMVLDDGLIANLDRDRFARVLAPKVRGAEILDDVTRGLPLDYFVLFSSSTTLVGNPGQGNYVAANAYMEGIARRRRQEGLKALAIGWGPITDAGVLARSERLRARFRKLTGIRGMRANEALDLMAAALETPPAASLAVMTISPTEGIVTADRLPVLGSPTYATLVKTGPGDAERPARGVDLYELAKSGGVESARQALTDIVVAQLSRILHLRSEEIPRIRPLGEIGVDSLMAIEVAMNLEEVLGFPMTLTSALGSLTVAGLANEMIRQLGVDAAPEAGIARTLAERHADRIEPGRVAILEQIVGERRQGARP